MEKINYGYIEDKIESEHWIYGSSALPKVILRKDGQWLDYLPETEEQRKKIETYACTIYSTLFCVEILMYEMFGAIRDYSERFIAIAINLQPPGTSEQTTAEAVRKLGVIKEEVLPFDDTIDTREKYLSPNPLTKDLLSLGKQFLAQYGYGHEWLWSYASPANKIKLMKENLQYSPLSVPVYAWEQNDEGLYANIGNQPSNHLTTCVGYVEGKHWIIFDSYKGNNGEYIKKLVWDYPFGTVKRHSLSYLGIIDKTNDAVVKATALTNEISTTPQKKSELLSSLIAFLKNLLNFLQ